MLFSIVLTYLPYSLVTAFTPGPNNIVALHAVSQNGWRKGRHVLFGIAAGFLCVMVLCALFCYELSKYIPALSGLLRYVGAAYIVWLAVHVARSTYEEGGGRQMSFWEGVFLEFANFKIILYAITIYTGYVLPSGADLPSLLFHALCITSIGMAGVLTWACAGRILQRFLARHSRFFHLAMALILVYCAVTLAASAASLNTI